MTETAECKCTLPDDLRGDPLRHKKDCPIFKAYDVQHRAAWKPLEEMDGMKKESKGAVG